MEIIGNIMRLSKRIFIAFIFLFVCGAAYGQKVTFEADAPSMVAAGSVFKIEYTINASPDNFIQPDLEDFEVIAGPSYSWGSEISITNGNVVQNENHIYTYVVSVSEPGIVNVPVARVVVDGKEYTSKSIPVEVIEEGAGNGGSSGQAAGAVDQNQTTPTERRPAAIGDEDLILRAVVDKTNVYKGQPVKVTFKLYYKVRIVGFENIKVPAFNGFWNHELNSDHYKPQRENYNSSVYESIILREYLLYPQQSGNLQIEQFDLTAVAQIVVQNRSRSIFDDFFGGGPQIEQVSKRVVSNPISIKVNDWPANAPADFNGAVGNFTVTSEFSEGEINANSSSNYTIKITGSGNLPLIQSPRFEAPATFEQYNVKTTESFNPTTAGISGYKQFEYPLIPRAEGEYTIDPVKFTFFNPETAQYQTLSTKEYNVIVLPDSTGGRSVSGGIVSGLSKEDIKILGQDIRFIKLSNPGLVLSGNLFMGSPLYFVLLLTLLAVFAFALIYLRKRLREMNNLELVRGKKANKVALQRLKAAENFMKTGSQRNFYEEMLKALWGYMGDKLNIPAVSLTKENIREELVKRGISLDEASRYIDIITDCEYAQYSPATSGQMHEIYRNAVAVISKLESIIKR